MSVFFPEAFASSGRRPVAGLRRCLVRGFSLIELIVVLMMISILMFMVVPDMSQWLKQSRVSETQNRLRGFLALARQEAVRYGGRVVVCVSRDQIRCEGSSTRGWHLWRDVLMFRDRDQNRQLDAGDEMIQTLSFTSGAQIIWNRGYSTVYEGNGSLRGGSNGSFYIFHTDEPEAGTKLVLQMSGRVRSDSLSGRDLTRLEPYLGQ